MPLNIVNVKNMVCHRCVLSVEGILEKANILYLKVLLGEIRLNLELSSEQKEILSEELEKVGFEMIDNHKSGLIEKIKLLAIQKARNEVDKKEMRLNLSVYLSEKLNYEYTHLSSLFSSVEGRTIENFFIEQRIEKAKELLVYRQMTLSEIAFELDYSSTAHLSAQFKRTTGLTPSYFKEVGMSKRKALDKV
ncbi:MAG: helix-turn-helix transcriptional regulator [Saprospiraceae bacterium]|nr:helix-turn-helix transcriptional regulator [Saprospiraceae bacterium]